MNKVQKLYDSGEIKSIFHVNDAGQLHGHYILFNRRGFKVIETTYRNGLIHGTYYLFSNDE